MHDALHPRFALRLRCEVIPNGPAVDPGAP
jgi:hypothetical protein